MLIHGRKSPSIYPAWIKTDLSAVITNIKDSVRIPKETDIVKVYISGKNWNWMELAIDVAIRK